MNKLDFERVGPPRKTFMTDQMTHAESVSVLAEKNEQIEALTRQVAELQEQLAEYSGLDPAIRKAMADSQLSMWESYCSKKIEVEELTDQLTAATAHITGLQYALDVMMWEPIRAAMTQAQREMHDYYLAIESPDDALKEHDAALVERIAALGGFDRATTMCFEVIADKIRNGAF